MSKNPFKDTEEKEDKIHDSEVAPRFKSFEEFYPFYLSQHSNPLTKLFHFIGTGIA